MTNKVLIKKSSVTSKIPTTADLDYGELAINYTDEKLYFKNTSNEIKSFNVTLSSVTFNNSGTGAASSSTFNGSSAVTISHNTIGAAALTGATFTGDVNAPNFNTSSDKNLKENITGIQSALDIINHLHGVSYNWKDSGHKSYGFIAQEVDKILPELVQTNPDTKTLTLNYQGIIPFLVEAIKEQFERIKLLEEQLINNKK